jgi:hypothetical protein
MSRLFYRLPDFAKTAVLSVMAFTVVAIPTSRLSSASLPLEPANKPKQANRKSNPDFKHRFSS